MKRFVCLVTLNSLVIFVMAQTSLCITTDKTTSLIFPFAIRHVDRGTQSVLVQLVKKVPTILLVKAATKNFPETNLSVVTDDGSVYSFTICYDSKPAVWVHNLPVNQKATITTYANAIMDNGQTIHGIKDEKWDMLAKIKGIYVKSDVIYYQIYLSNQSTINYDIDLLGFYIRDKKKSKRTAIQENELKPLCIVGNTSYIKANSNSVIVVALDKFTIPDAKYFAIQIMEKNGGRHLFMKITNEKIIQAIQLPDLK